METDGWDNRPDLTPALEPFYRCFLELSNRRTMGYSSPNAISLTELESWLNLNGVEDCTSRADYCSVIIALDQTFLEHKHGRQ